MAVAERSGDEARLRAVVAFADRVLQHGRGAGPLFADGVDGQTLRPVQWTYTGTRLPADRRAWVLSNLAAQQNLFRTFAGLSALTGEPRYREAACGATAHHFARLCSPCGLLRWGGHQCVDLATGAPFGPVLGDCHELKHVYPFYELMWEVDPAGTRRFVEAFWNAHVLDWSTLDCNRHGAYGRPMGVLWRSAFAAPAPFFHGDGLSFLNCGSDLILAGAMLHALGGEEGALLWALRLAEQYVRARDPRTGLGVYQFSQPRVRAEPVEGSTLSMYGDRALRQLGPELGPAALEGNVLDPGRAETIYGHAAIVQLQLAERLGEAGRAFGEWTRAGLAAYAEHGYDPATNLLRPMLADGTDLTGFALQRDGYYGPRGRVFAPAPAGGLLLWSYALGHRVTGDPLLWETARAMARGCGLGDLGRTPGDRVAVDLGTSCSDPLVLYAVLEAWAAAPCADYLDLGRAIAENLVRRSWHGGFFLPSADHACARFDAVEPLALLALEGAIRGRAGAVPAYRSGSAFLHGHMDDGGRTTDVRAIWGRRR